MALRPKGRRPVDDDARVLPLINVVFLLLIFFMIAGSLSAVEPFQVDPPTSRSEAAAPESDWRLTVSADGRLALNGKELSEAEALGRIERALDDGTPLALKLKVDGAAEAVEMVALMEKLRAAGLTRLHLMTATEPRQ